VGSAHRRRILLIMGWIAAAGQMVRELVGAPRPIPLDLQPMTSTELAQFDIAPQPIDKLLTFLKGGGNDAAPVSRDMALSVAAVQRGRNEICSIATLPLRLYQANDIVDSPLFRQFDPDVPNVIHLAMTIEDLLFEGIAWWQITGRGYDRYPAMVKRLDPGRVSLTPPAKPGVTSTPAGYVMPGKDSTGPVVYLDGHPFPVRDLIRFDSPNPALLTANARAIRTAVMVDQLAAVYAANPRPLDYFTDNELAAGDEMNTDDIDSFLAEWQSNRQAAGTAWIPSTVKRVDVNAPSPAELQLVEIKRQAGLEIANGIGVDPEDLGVSTTSRTYFNAVDKRQTKINNTYAPFMSALVDRLSMGDITKRGYAPRFDLKDYLKADPTTQIGYWKGLRDLGAISPLEIRGEAGYSGPVPDDAAVTEPPAAAGGAQQNRLRLVAGFDAGVDHTFASVEFDAAVPAPTVDREARTITGLAVPYGAVASKYGMKFRFMPGSLEYGDVTRIKHLMDHTTPVGFHTSVDDTAAGPVVKLSVLDGPEGSPAKLLRDQLLYDAEHGLYDGLSVGVSYDLDPEAGDVVYNEDDDVYDVVRASWRETSTTPIPAFDDARVTKVAASHTGGNMHCVHCGGAHAPGIACAVYAAQLNPSPGPAPAPTPAPTPAPGPGAPAPTPEQAPTYAQYAAFIAAQAAAQAPAPGPVLVNPTGHPIARVNEAPPYRFDRFGNLGKGTHDFSTDLVLGWKDGDQAARDRAQAFLDRAFSEGNVGNLQANVADQQFAITPANVANLNYPANRPDMYVDQLDYQYPMYAAMFKGTLDAVTPFVVPKFSSSSGLVADHVTGTEPTPGTFVATAQTITPSALSGKVEITREAFDQGGNPQMSGLIWRQMVRAWYEGLEAYAQAQLVTNAASIADILITTALADSALDQALADAIVPLQYIRGGDRFRTVFTQIDLYKAMVKAKDGSGRRLYPSIGAQNAVGTADPRYAWLDAHGKLWTPAWATAATGTVAASSWMFDPEYVCLWASTPQRIDLQWRVAWVDVGIWGYKAFAITDFTRTRELIYDPV
jgi:hypothetical protein